MSAVVVLERLAWYHVFLGRNPSVPVAGKKSTMLGCLQCRRNPHRYLLDLGMSSSRKWSRLSGSAFNEARPEVKGPRADRDAIRKAVQQVVDARRTTIVVMHSSGGTKPSEKISRG